MFSLKALSPNLIQKSCFLTFSALLLGACAQKFNDLPNTRVLKTCQEPIASYHLMGYKVVIIMTLRFLIRRCNKW